MDHLIVVPEGIGELFNDLIALGMIEVNSLLYNTRNQEKAKAYLLTHYVVGIRNNPHKARLLIELVLSLEASLKNDNDSEENGLDG